jgi:hypothetical protein
LRNGSKELVFLPTAFVDDLLAVVITPLRETQALFSEYGTLTRLYTTLSASEMTRDPVFDFNPDLPQVSNQMDTAGEPVPIRRLTVVTQNVEGALPASYDLEAAYPNPFNAAVLLPFRVPQGLTTADLTLRVYNLLGQPVRYIGAG